MDDFILTPPTSEKNKKAQEPAPSLAKTLSECKTGRTSLRHEITKAQHQKKSIPEDSFWENLTGKETQNDIARKNTQAKIQKFLSQLKSLPSSLVEREISLSEAYGTLIEYYQELSRQAKTPEEKKYFEERSDIQTFYLQSHRHLESRFKENQAFLSHLKTQKFLSEEKFLELSAEISGIQNQLQQKISHYTQVFNANACGDARDLKQTIEPAKAVIEGFSNASEQIHQYENVLGKHLLEYSKTHPFDQEVQKASLSFLHNTHSDRIHSWTQQVMALSHMQEIQTFHANETDLNIPENMVPEVNPKTMREQQKKILESFQNGGKEMKKSLVTFKTLADPSFFSQQGRAQIGEEFLDGIQEKVMPEWAQEILKWAEGEEAQQSITQTFQKFSLNPAFQKYQNMANKFANPNDEIYQWMKNPYEENQDKLQKFLEEMSNTEKEYLEAFYQLSSDLQKKGVEHAQLQKMIEWVQENLLLTVGVGVAGTVITAAMIVRLLKWGGKKILIGVGTAAAAIFAP